MNCEEAIGALDSYLDNELVLNSRLELEQHLSHCISCWCLAHERRESRSFFAAGTTTYKAPPELRARVLASVRREKGRQANFAVLRQPWIYAAAVFILSLSLALNFLFPDIGKEFSRQAVLCQSCSISDDHLVEIASTNPQEVKAWLTARLNFSPPVVVFPTSAYSLLGGRVDMIANRLVATVVYKKEKEVIALFCWPPNKEHLSEGDHFIEAYHVCTWSNAECNYILVSKLSDREMDQFMDLFRDRVQGEVFY